MPSSELEDLDALLKAPGWLRFCHHAEHEWSGRIEQLMATAVNDTDDKLALDKMRQVIAAKQAIVQLMRWPHDRLAELGRVAENHHKESHVPLSRRGTL
jgi:hypothetical protein